MGQTNRPPLTREWVENFGNTISEGHKGKWSRNSAGEDEYTIKSPYRSDDKTPSFSINRQKRIGYDRGTDTTYNISDMCCYFHENEPNEDSDVDIYHRKVEEVNQTGQKPIPSTLAVDEAQKTAEKQRFLDEAREAVKKAASVPADFPYLIRKHIKPLNAKFDGKDLIIPACDANSVIVGYEYIKLDGSKGQAKGTSKAGSFGLVAGHIQPLHDVIVAEGFATAASLHEITGLCTVESFGSANLAAVVEIVKRKGARAILCPDYDSYDSAKSAGADVLVKLPNLPDYMTWPDDCKDGKWDWNDYCRAAGVDEAKAAWAVSLAGGVNSSRSECFKPQRMKEEDKRMIADLFPVNMYSALIAEEKTGKSWFMLYEAAKVSLEDSVLYLNGELAQEYMNDRQARALWDYKSENFHIINADDPNFPTFSLDTDNGLKILEDEIRKAKPCLVIVDSLAAWMSKDESDSESMGNMLNGLKRFAKHYKLAVVVVHHYRKRKASERNLPHTKDDAVGSGKLTRLAGAVYGLEKQADGWRLLKSHCSWLKEKRSDGIVFSWRLADLDHEKINIEINDNPELLDGVKVEPVKQTKAEILADKIKEDYPQEAGRFCIGELTKRYYTDRHTVLKAIDLLIDRGEAVQLEAIGEDGKTKYYCCL